MATDLMVDTARLQQAAAHLDDATRHFRRVDDTATPAPLRPDAFGSGGAAGEVVQWFWRRLRQGAECAELLSRRSDRLADGLRVTATQFDATESALAGGPR